MFLLGYGRPIHGGSADAGLAFDVSGRRTLPRDLSAFEIEAFFNFSDAERRVIEDRRGALKLALALQIGFLRMTGRLLEAVRIVPPALWRHGAPRLDPFYAELNSHKAAMFIHPTSPSCGGCGVLALGYPRPMLEFILRRHAR